MLFVRMASTKMSSLSDMMAKAQPLPRNERVIPARVKKMTDANPAMAGAMKSFMDLHGMKFHANAGRGFKKKGAAKKAVSSGY